MARTIEIIQANTVAALETAVNAYLATLVGGASLKITGFSIALNDADRFLGTEYSAMISTESTGAAAMSAPYVLKVFQAGNDADLTTAITSYLTTHAADFVTGVRNITKVNVSRLQLLTAWAVSSTDTADATTDWTPV